MNNTINDIKKFATESIEKTTKPHLVKTQSDKDIASAANIKMVDEYLNLLDWEVNENSNMTYSIQGLNNYIAANISKNYWLNKIYTPEIRNAHTNGDIHIHDLMK
ncbi:hypothetical protein IJE86_07800 [bacterium]|nr:hypothetical protein [bacterium]